MNLKNMDYLIHDHFLKIFNKLFDRVHLEYIIYLVIIFVHVNNIKNT